MATAGSLQAPHKHGSLEVAITNSNEFLIFKMAIPSQDLLGFEDSPTTSVKKERIIEQYEKLYKEEALPNLFKFIPAEACKPQSADMLSDMLEYHEHDDIKDAVEDEQGHSDFLLSYVFKCGKVDLVQITFHEVFPSIERVNYYADGDLNGEAVASVEAEDAVSAGFSEE